MLLRIHTFLSYTLFSLGVFLFLNSRWGGVRLPGEFGGPASVRVPPHLGVPSPSVFYPPVYIPSVDMTLGHRTSPLGTPKIQKKTRLKVHKGDHERSKHPTGVWVGQRFDSCRRLGFFFLVHTLDTINTTSFSFHYRAENLPPLQLVNTRSDKQVVAFG